uniref:hypothetical protein n=1 Tax=Pseudomonas aeruginosa TaxID=287 RepID=UPI001ADA6AEF
MTEKPSDRLAAGVVENLDADAFRSQLTALPAASARRWELDVSAKMGAESIDEQPQEAFAAWANPQEGLSIG